MTPTVRAVILSGGAGTRLWPLSTARSPKQFMELVGEPLFEATLRRLRGIQGIGPVTVVAGGDHLDAVVRAGAATGVTYSSIVVEPVGRNTGPAVLAAALVADPDDVLLVLPSDHIIGDVEAFRSAVEAAISLATDGALVTFGVLPTRTETGYGYIQKGSAVDGAFRVARFKEKPDIEEATRLATDGAHLWNSGMFVFKTSRLLEEMERHSPDLMAGVRRALPAEWSDTVRLEGSFSDLTPISIDHAVMERTDEAVVLPIDVGWSDLGSWQALWEASRRDSAGNAMIGDVTALEVSTSYVHSTSRPVAIAGVDGLVVVETPDVVLVVPRVRSQLVRDLVTRSEAEQPPD